jgi:hypothetical protein
MLTEVGIGRRHGGEMTSVRSGGEEMTGARGGGRRGALWASWYFDQRRTRAGKVMPGLGGRRCAGKGELRRRRGGNVGSCSNPSSEQAVPGLGCAGSCGGLGWPRGRLRIRRGGAGRLGVGVSRTMELPLLTGSLRIVPICARRTSRRSQVGDEASMRLGLGAA